MRFVLIKQKAHDLFQEAAFISQIHNNRDYKKALKLMDVLIEDYDDNRPLIDVLSASIERWEEKSKEFEAFNQRIKSLDSGVAVLKVLIEQHRLHLDDFPEIGSKSLLSKILNHERQLTLAHVKALSQRFGLEPSLFI